ncbi:hypothetical protein V1508DRAFT_457756 [Lipomyces doorenjongii]|uniref:uncharacterized protein n=1 Tax=Lipomyces doorenjongii TaxID=383834 RepID=UPI0034CF56EC
MPAISSSDMLPGKDRDFSSDYDEALFLLKTNPPEQRLPYSQYPSLSYNSLMQIATVVTTQSALHGRRIFREIIASSVIPMPQMQVAIERGFSENYKALCRDKDLPHYKSPRTASENMEDAATAVKNMVKYVAEAMANALEQGNYGPIEYRGHIWVGKLDEVFDEVWKADGQQPVRKWLIRHEHPNPLSRTIGLKDIMEAMKLTAKARFVRFLTSKEA